MLSESALQARRAEAHRRMMRRRRRSFAALALLIVIAVVLLAVSTGGSSGVKSTPSKATSGRAAKPVTITVEASGDLLIHGPVFERALELGGGSHFDFAPLFYQIKPIIQGVDLPLCHVETPMTPSTPTGYPIFNTPPELAVAIHQTGFRACSTAATHTLDEGQRGIDDTNRALDQAGVLHTGAFSNPTTASTPLIFSVKGVRVAFLAYTELTNGIPSPHPWSVNRANAPQILADAHQAREDGAQVVIVNIHWGDEYVTKPSAFQLHVVDKLTQSPDITAIVGQHVHVPQPIRTINGKLVVFGEGNLISNQTEACCVAASQDGLIALLTITVQGNNSAVTAIHYVPIWVQHPSFEVLPVGTGLRTDPADAAALRASYKRTVEAAGRSPEVQPIPAQLPPG